MEHMDHRYIVKDSSKSKIEMEHIDHGYKDVCKSLNN